MFHALEHLQRACGLLAFALPRILPTVGAVMRVLVHGSRHGWRQCRCASAQWRVPASSAGVSARFFVKGSQSHDLAKLGGATMPIECQGTSPLKFVALSLLLYNEHAFQQTPQDPPIRSKQEQTLQTAATQQQYRAATQQPTTTNSSTEAMATETQQKSKGTAWAP